MIKNYIFLCFLIFCFIGTNAQQPYQVYFGNLHSHTSNSDGESEPEDAYNYARYTAGLDFLAVSDHLEQIDPLEWYLVKDEADNATVNGTFVAIAAWEWGSPLHGHVNVFNTSSIISDAVNLWYTTDLPAFIDWVLDHAPAMAQFNHPGEESYFTNWNDFTYIDTITDNAFPLIEVQTVQQATDYYEYALNKGWHLSPVWNQDNHSANWGTKNDGRAGIWATSLTRSALFDAIGAGRTFATMDKNASIWLDISGTPFGETVQRYTNMPFHINLQDTDNETWQQIELVSNNGVVLTFPSQGSLDTIITLPLFTDDYLFVRGIQSDSDYIWSAPVYFAGLITNTDELESQCFKYYPNPVKDVLHFEAFNNSPFSMEIYDINSRLVYRKTTSESVINVSNMKSGLYFFKAYTDTKLLTGSLIKE
ncbi:MAG: CehA/McbA family metallohydrolase [Bacteroidales bacterium]|nr:CehA/McbA family metallohydrolase [Bacteroidales bacterium]